ncbi:hypothetical protein BYT27DRAFT_7220393 [Phlegmacium glaucopus]|nr:hypothetical protein BYT27DRAFT_7220393 [Phlegmacium glaucopus]
MALTIETLSNLAHLKDLKLSMEFIQALDKASLDDEYSGLDSDTTERLRNPPTSRPDISNPDFRLGLDLFLASIKSSQDTYNMSRDAVLRRHPDDKVPSYDQMKRRIAEITGIVPIVHDMCGNSCMAFTGPLSKLDACTECNAPRLNPLTKKADQHLYTIPPGPQLQALWRDDESVKRMYYRRKKTRKIITELQNNHGSLFQFTDFLHGSAYLNAVRMGRIKDTDMVLMLSIDSAQLFEHKASDVWIYIWVVFDLAPDLRYKKKYVLPGGFFPGKPKIVESLLFPGLHHLAALQHEGLQIWNALEDIVFTSNPFLALATADGPGMAYLNGLVGHHGKYGCRLYCSVTGRHKPGGLQYYPALLKPNNYAVQGCDHDDISFANLPSCSQKDYFLNLHHLMSSLNETQYKKRRLKTGISKPTIFLGLQQDRILGIPGCFGSDIMHLGSLNLPDLLINLWRGTLDCDKKDDISTWEWVTLRGSTWEEHGRQVAAMMPYLPGSFNRPPRNPAEKISSGYKAWEFLLYLFGLGPGLLLKILPDKYYRNFCKLVFGIRIIHQHQINQNDLQRAHEALLEFAYEFEQLYYQRRSDRIHFVRQSIHALTHLGPEVTRIGPPTCSSQWTMERTIGNLGQEVRQHSNPYANLSQRGLLRSQINALKAMIPGLDPLLPVVPRGGKDIGAGFILLRAKDKALRVMRDCERQAHADYLTKAHALQVPEGWSPEVTRWARLHLPNGQVARSAWKEKLKPLDKVRMARNVKTEMTLAVVSLYSHPCNDLLEYSYHTLLSCSYMGDAALCVIDVKSIVSVVGMVPHCAFPGALERYFVIEKPGLDIAVLGGVAEVVPDEE